MPSRDPTRVKIQPMLAQFMMIVNDLQNIAMLCEYYQFKGVIVII